MRSRYSRSPAEPSPAKPPRSVGQLGRFLDQFLRLLRRAGREKLARARKTQRIACRLLQIDFQLADRIAMCTASIEGSGHNFRVLF